MRFGLIGYGAWGRHHAAAFGKAPGAELGAIACRSEATAAAARQDFPGVSVHRDYRELLARPDLDAVDIVVPNDFHAEIGVAALEAGKDVLLEKPMASTPGECDRLIQAARASGRVLSIGHEFRLSTQWGRIKALLDAGEIGEPMYALVSLFRFPYRPGSGGWRYKADRVGSWILEEPVHFFDSVMWYFERWGDPVAVLAGFEHHRVMEVVGSEGAVRTWWSGAMDRTRAPTFELKVRRRGAMETEAVPLAVSGEVFELEEEIRRTVAAFRLRRPLVSGEEARKRVVVCREAERSLREGREVLLTF
jgi:myo-inositol 2-dehydrogenase/D-chiro-inositol 1-dehydrogenase